jgi:hypothetical protein
VLGGGEYEPSARRAKNVSHLCHAGPRQQRIDDAAKKSDGGVNDDKFAPIRDNEGDDITLVDSLVVQVGRKPTGRVQGLTAGQRPKLIDGGDSRGIFACVTQDLIHPCFIRPQPGGLELVPDRLRDPGFYRLLSKVTIGSHNSARARMGNRTVLKIGQQISVRSQVVKSVGVEPR